MRKRDELYQIFRKNLLASNICKYTILAWVLELMIRSNGKTWRKFYFEARRKFT